MKTTKQISKAVECKMAYATDFITVRKGEVEIYVERNGDNDYEATEAIKKDFKSNLILNVIRAKPIFLL